MYLTAIEKKRTTIPRSIMNKYLSIFCAYSEADLITSFIVLHGSEQS